jgi:hypothetical protein
MWSDVEHFHSSGRIEGVRDFAETIARDHL